MMNSETTWKKRSPAPGLRLQSGGCPRKTMAKINRTWPSSEEGRAWDVPCSTGLLEVAGSCKGHPASPQEFGTSNALTVSAASSARSRPAVFPPMSPHGPAPAGRQNRGGGCRHQRYL